MMRSEIQKQIRNAITALWPGIALPSIDVSVPEQEGHGDYASNIAFGLSRQLKKSPIELATALKEQLSFSSCDSVVAAPGFINFYVSDKEIIYKQLGRILVEKERYGCGSAKNQKVQVEFISANPTGPLTMANGRGGFFGDVLARVLEHQGNEVEREYYINDAGNQIKTLGLSALAAAGTVTDDESFYHGEYIGVWAKANPDLLQAHQDDPEYLGRILAKYLLETMIKPSVADRMDIHFDRWTSEYADIRGKKYVEKFLDSCKEKNLIYVQDGAEWLKTTDYGDDKDRVLITADKLPTYFLVDAGHYLETKERGFGKKINIVGADHHGYVGRIQAVAKMIGLADSEVIVMQLVRLVKDGQEMRMSKRRGAFVTIDALIEEAGIDAVRYFFLERSPDTHISFNLAFAKERSAQNPVYYIQYAHARMASILRKSPDGTGDLQNANPALLTQPEEITLIKRLIRFPDLLEDTARDYRIHNLPRYALELARDFHNFYEKHRVISNDHDLMLARLTLITATKIILGNTLALLGINAPEEM